MRIVILLLLSIAANNLFSQVSNNPITPIQRVTNLYLLNNSISNDNKIGIKNAVRKLEAAGIYDKLYSLNICRYSQNQKIYNVVSPLDLKGAFTLTIEGGDPSFSERGIVLKAGDTLNTHFVNDLVHDAPNMGVFWYTDVPVEKHLIYSKSPFNIEPRYTDGKAYIQIWSSTQGLPVPVPSNGFNLAQRNNEVVEIFQGSEKFSQKAPINSSNPKGNEILIIGNDISDFTLEIFGVTKTLSQDEAVELKNILDELISNLE